MHFRPFMWPAALLLPVGLLVGTRAARSDASSSYEALIAAVEADTEGCDASRHRRHGDHKKCCLRSWPAEPEAAAALGMMVVYPTSEEDETEDDVSFSQALGVYRLGSDGQWAAVLSPGRQALTLAGKDGAERHIRYDGPPHAVSITHTEGGQTVRSYVGRCADHGPWWWDGRSAEAVLDRLAEEGALPVDCPAAEGPFSDRDASGALVTGFRRADGTTVTCAEAGTAITEQALQVEITGDLGRILSKSLEFPTAWGCVRDRAGEGNFLVPGGEQALRFADGLPIGAAETTDGVAVQWPAVWEVARYDGGPERVAFAGQGVVTITEGGQTTTVDVRIGPGKKGALTMQGHGRIRQQGSDGTRLVDGHFFDGARDSGWTMKPEGSAVETGAHYGPTGLPKGVWTSLFAAQPRGCDAALQAMQQAAAPVASPAVITRLQDHIRRDTAKLDARVAVLEAGTMDAADRRFIGCARDAITRLKSLEGDLSRALDSGQPPTGACPGWLDTAMRGIVSPGEDCRGWPSGAGLSRSARSYLTAQKRHQELACRCERLGDDADAWLEEVGRRAAGQWP